MAILSYLYSWVKPRQSRQDDQSNKTFTFIGKKKRTKSDVVKVEEEDHQRQIMIRKSLQSRASSRATDRAREDYEDGDTEEEERNPGLKSDWKAYEADIQRNRDDFKIDVFKLMSEA
ncbi:hypothetical protein CEP52_000006 [Fusarium oligoseptatum]|uniref:Uncharacterized protein n=1 Tax=Fusarium oligoseptatum TaxID=2604345 RepID=A0A428UQ29_9HYPO|nr:hypothetical protein CEP52_000006 [Fusarium oligoseptatum]